MSQKEQMIANLLKEIDGYFMQLVYLKDMIEVEEDVSNSDKLKETSPNLKLIVECALIDSYMLAFVKLYDKSEKTKTIPNLIKKCKDSAHLFPSKNEVVTKLEEFEKELAENEYLVQAIEILRRRRDTVLVHNDNKYFGEKLTKDDSYLPKYKLWMLRDFTERVLTYLHSQLTDNQPRQAKYDKDLHNLFH